MNRIWLEVFKQTLSQILAHHLMPLGVTVYLPNGELRKIEDVINDLSDLYSEKELENE